MIGAAYIGPTSVVQLVLPRPLDSGLVRLALINATDGVVGTFAQVTVSTGECATYTVDAQESSSTNSHVLMCVICVCVCLSVCLSVYLSVTIA